MQNNLSFLFSPKSIAVIGASRHRGTVGAELFHNILSNSYQGVVYPVNPKASSIQAVRAYPKIQDIPDSVDLAIIVVPQPLVLQAVQGCVEKKVKSIIIISAGFKEVGVEGAKVENQIFELCRKNNIRLVGPNCMGMVNTDPEVRLDATFAPTYPPEGNVAFSSQSGALGHAILEYAKELGIGVSKFVSIGNKADVSGNDLIEYWEKDPRTQVILLYLESFGNPRRFLDLARRIGRKKPIVAVKGGRSAAGAKAAASHTGSLATSDVLVETLFRQAGVIRTDTVEDLFDVAMLLSNQPLPQGRRVAILTNAGGPGILAADACESFSLQLAEFSSFTTKRLKKLIPPQASAKNPIDLTAHGTPEIYRKAISVLLADPGVDCLIVIYVPPLVTQPKEVADAIVSSISGTKKTVLTCFMGKHGVPEGLQSLKKAKIPSYVFPEDAVKALAQVADHVSWKQKPSGKIVTFSDFQLQKIRTLQKKKGWLSAKHCFDLLQSAKLPVVTTKTGFTLDEVVKAGNEIKFPVVLKVDSTRMLHKSDQGGVLLGLNNEKELIQAYDQIVNNIRKAGISWKEISGFQIQSMAPKGEEVIVGVSRDEKFGALFMFGLGGIEIEIHRDVSFRIHPLTDIDAEEMISEIRGIPLLRGFRGKPSCDLKAIQNLILRLSHLINVMPEIRELDLNPVRVFSKGVLVLDARIRLDENH